MLDAPAPVPPKKKKKSYQSFGADKNGSDSSAKLAGLRLERLGSFKRKSVLDLGCNEGYFCEAALQRGAARVLGIDQWPGVINRARKRFPTAEFQALSWWDLPDERFDVILFLSAVHYEQNQMALFDKLLKHLTPEGVLVLECGLAPSHKFPGWVQVYRPADSGPRRYPTFEHLRDHLMPGYALNLIGPSVAQKGDPIPRWVIHCRRRKPIVLIVHGSPKEGKSTFASAHRDAATPVYRSDGLLRRLVTDPLYQNTPLAVALRAVGLKKCPELSQAIATNEDWAQQFAQIVCDEFPLEAPHSIIEGEAFSHPSIMGQVTELLAERGAAVWTAQREA